MKLEVRRLHILPSLLHRITFGSILEPYYQNGDLANCSSRENKKLIDEIVEKYSNVFDSPNQIKNWVYRRNQKGKNAEKCNVKEVIEFESDLKIPSPDQVTSLNYDRWCHYLKDCPLKDKYFVLDGIKNGFSLMFNQSELKSANSNLPSAIFQPTIIDDYLQKELSFGTMAGPYDKLPYQNSQINRIGVIPKSNGKWRLITDLSYPFGFSVNDGISQEDSLVSYVGLTAAIEKIVSIGKGSLLANFDLKRAYRMVPIRDDERHLLIMKWKDQYYVDLALPFGARSAPSIFTRFSNVLEWILMNHGPIKFMQHSLDDFIIFGPSSSTVCHDSLQRSFELCDKLGVPIAHSKTNGPSTNIVFLGLEIDTDKMEIRLPEDKLDKTKAQVEEWLVHQTGTRKSLLSLVGSLYYCSQVIVQGEKFISSLTERAYNVERSYYKVRLRKREIQDLLWWHHLFENWNGRSLLNDIKSSIKLYT